MQGTKKRKGQCVQIEERQKITMPVLPEKNSVDLRIGHKDEKKILQKGTSQLYLLKRVIKLPVL
jgi:hypothetical protein